MLRPVLTMIVLCGALAGAEASTPLPQGAAPELGPGEGHLVLVFDSLNEIRSLRLTSRMSIDTALAVDRIEPGVSAQTFRVPAGDYCIDSLRTGRVIYKRREGDRGLCFEVAAGTLTYPGHIAPRGSSDRDAVINVEVKAPEFLRRMRLEQPRLLDAHRDLRTGRGARAAAWAEFGHGAFDAGEPALGAALLERAAAEGDAVAKMELAFRAVQGDGVPEDKKRARLLYEEVAAGGNLLAARHACMANIDGWDGAPDPVRAQRFCTLGIERGDAVSAVLLVQLRRRGALPREPARELELARFAAEKGSAEGWSLLGLGLLESAPPDRAGARAAFEKAAADGNGSGSYQLGLMLLAECGAPRDASHILELFEVGASQNVPGAAIAAGRLLASGEEGLPPDQARALAHLERAARTGPDGVAALAWFLATSPADELRDGVRARRYATQLLTMREQRRPDDYAVLAAVYAENGDFDGALRNVERAIEGLASRAAPDDPRLAAWQSQRQSYLSQRPWREIPR